MCYTISFLSRNSDLENKYFKKINYLFVEFFSLLNSDYDCYISSYIIDNPIPLHYSNFNNFTTIELG